MGAETFEQWGTGKTAKEAFKSAYDEACYDFGHRGYTGSMAEKDDFVLISAPHPINVANDEEVEEYARKLVDECDERVDDKWGPAGCIKGKDNQYLFFGWASS
jgi:hypothetical protein